MYSSALPPHKATVLFLRITKQHTPAMLIQNSSLIWSKADTGDHVHPSAHKISLEAVHAEKGATALWNSHRRLMVGEEK